MGEELKQFNINVNEIEQNNDLFGNIREAINKMQRETMKDRFEVVLNNNLIECKEKMTNYITILGCRVSYQDLEESISFIVKEDDKPTYEQLEQQNKALEEQIEKAIEYMKSIKNEPDYDMYTEIGNYEELKAIQQQIKELGWESDKNDKSN